MHGPPLCSRADKSHFSSTETRYANKTSDKCGGLTSAGLEMFLSNPFQLFDNLRCRALSKGGWESLLLIDWLCFQEWRNVPGAISPMRWLRGRVAT